ncbi:Peptidoglycan/LPS O-acetylase OafA/YrhL, contains acyltransferase and SGNH-hydrolase domains [Pseudomonas sp. LAMO17WK12:I10]|uniref:acyltransferase family protein n=1 Tax=unclassified Pseudomonas TaxID=196821 RepID=UPI000BD09DCD|nr:MULTISPECIES: acyltransferase [unclassified Pseudomonas]PXX75713.1 peptidoglycan/LPS O-acetylase OafA/YrhL [Pseudomonas sp. LAMO17WK12:I9]SNY09547.1 Peptidoglycan/LPS O-acetylase OafA/YrhL, contains acyltransferase and SGNH-hydrolase domains [Pseudomonas sp. LAMO17WK12:I10]
MQTPHLYSALEATLACRKAMKACTGLEQVIAGFLPGWMDKAASTNEVYREFAWPLWYFHAPPSTDTSKMKNSILKIPLNRSRSQNIDTLRFLLAIWVVITHLAPWIVAIQGSAAIPESLIWLTRELESLFQGSGETHPAVLGFIVLSGYCIHRNGLRSHQDGLFSYAVRRFFRIYPVFLIAALFGFLMFYIASQISPDSVTSVSGTAELSFNNILRKLLTTEVIYPFDYYPSIQGNGPLQTVAAEMWLYAIYPLALLVIGKLSDRSWWVVVIICWIASIAINSFIPEWRGWSFNASLIGFIPYWWLGLKFTDQNFCRFMNRIVILPVIIWLLITLFEKDLQQYGQIFAAVRQLMFALCFASLISILDKKHSVSIKPLSAVGSAGYSIYAFHAPIVYVMVLCGAPWWLIGLSAVAIGVAAFHLIEKPFIAVGKRLSTSHTTLLQSRSSDPV